MESAKSELSYQTLQRDVRVLLSGKTEDMKPPTRELTDWDTRILNSLRVKDHRQVWTQSGEMHAAYRWGLLYGRYVLDRDPDSFAMATFPPKKVIEIGKRWEEFNASTFTTSAGEIRGLVFLNVTEGSEKEERFFMINKGGKIGFVQTELRMLADKVTHLQSGGRDLENGTQAGQLSAIADGIFVKMVKYPLVSKETPLSDDQFDMLASVLATTGFGFFAVQFAVQKEPMVEGFMVLLSTALSSKKEIDDVVSVIPEEGSIPVEVIDSVRRVASSPLMVRMGIWNSVYQKLGIDPSDEDRGDKMKKIWEEDSRKMVITIRDSVNDRVKKVLTKLTSAPEGMINDMSSLFRDN